MTLNVCAIFRNEALYLREWIEFHRLVGVDKFFLYHNRSADNWQTILQPYIASGVVEITEWPHLPPCQVNAYQDCINKRHGQDEWMAFIDCDEFLWSPRFSTLPEALATFPSSWGAVGVNWMCFGSGGQAEWEDRLVLERFIWRPAEQGFFNRHIKIIVRMDQVVNNSGDPHFFYAERGTFNEVGEPITYAESRQQSQILRINHYCTKSRQEWLTRNLSGKPDRNGENFVGDENIYNVFQPQDVEDHEIQRYLPVLKERCA